MKILLGALLVALVAADTCGGNCPGGCPTCFCGNTRKVEDISAWCARYSWNQECCRCIVSHESAGNAHYMHHNSNGSTDVGLWQINNINWGECNNGHAPCDTAQNLHCATQVYQDGGNTWKAWATHTACGCWFNRLSSNSPFILTLNH